LLAALPCFITANAAEDDKEKEVKEIRAAQARENARNEEGKRLMKQQQPPGKTPQPTAASSLPERDPFETSPTLLSEGEASKRRASVNIRTPNDAVFRALKLKALVRSNGGGVAQLLSGSELITLYDGDEIALEGRRYKVGIHPDGVKFQEQIPEGEQQETEGEPPRQKHTGWVR
jgi:hypothetical protein